MMRTTQSLVGMLLFAACGSTIWGSDEIPGAPQKQPIALVGGTVHTVSGRSIEKGMVVFDQGKIVQVGANVNLPENTRTIDISGKHVYPGMFESHSKLGLVEINAVRATKDYAETGRVNPNIKSWVAVNPDSESIPVTRSNGILLALTVPSGGLVSGKSAVIQLDGWTYEDMTIATDAAMHVQWPRIPAAVNVEKESADEETSSPLKPLRELFDRSRAYRRARDANHSQQEFDIRLEAMLAVIDRKIPLMVTANELSSIQSAVGFSVEQQIRLIIFGGYDAPHCADLLKAHDVPVIVSAIHRTPRNRDDAYDASYTLPERLRRAKVQFCISGADRSDTWNVRNLPYQAATAAAYGLPRDEAIRAITLYPAQILGVDDRVGSLDVGKEATLFVADGDPLETPTQVERAYIQGRLVDLSDRHKRLFNKYREKYRQIESD